MIRVLAPDSEWRMRSTSFGLTETGTLSGSALPVRAPYTTAGICPATRRRRASFFPRLSRFFASTVAAISTLPVLRRDRVLFVNSSFRLSQRPRHREDNDLLALLARAVQRDRVGHDQLIQRRVLDALGRRDREHAVH